MTIQDEDELIEKLATELAALHFQSTQGRESCKRAIRMALLRWRVYDCD